MTSQPGLQTVAILSNLSQSKGNQAMKFGHMENESGGLVPDLFLVFKKRLIWGENNGSAA